MKRWLNAVLVVTLLGMSSTLVNAAERISEIAFEGNEVTQDSVLRKEISIRVGDSFDVNDVERSRQEIQNLGLFRSVESIAETIDGGVRVTFKVQEKWFWQAYPRLSANSDGQNSIGLETRVNNLWGLNHTLRVVGRSRDTRRDDRGRDVSIRASYFAPYLLGERDSLRLGIARNTIPFDGEQAYEERILEAEAVMIRNYGLADRPSQGWNVGLGAVFRDQSVSDETVADSFGTSYAAVLEAGYRDARDNILSSEGRAFGVRYEVAKRDLLSDYSYSVLRGNWDEVRPLGARSHQQLAYGFSFGLANNAVDRRALFSLGGSEGLKGFERRAFEGNTFYLAHVDFMRPLIWDSLRWTAGLELGNAGWETRDLFDTPNLSLNVGLRFRPRRLVNFELEVGFAIPLGGDDPRFYGGKVDRP